MGIYTVPEQEQGRNRLRVEGSGVLCLKKSERSRVFANSKEIDDLA